MSTVENAKAIRRALRKMGALGNTIGLVVGSHGGDSQLQQAALDLVNMELRDELRKRFGRIPYRAGSRPKGKETFLRVIIEGDEAVLEAVREFTQDQLGMRWGGVALSFTLFQNGRKVRI